MEILKFLCYFESIEANPQQASAEICRDTKLKMRANFEKGEPHR